MTTEKPQASPKEAGPRCRHCQRPAAAGEKFAPISVHGPSPLNEPYCRTCQDDFVLGRWGLSIGREGDVPWGGSPPAVFDHPLLRAEDLELLERASRSDDREVLRLRDLVLRLGALKMSEGHFPTWVALINETNRCAFAIKRAEVLPVGDERLVWKGGGGAAALAQPMVRRALTCDISDAFLFLRPCVKLGRSMETRTRNRLFATAGLEIFVENRDGKHPIWSGPLSAFAADEAGYGLHRQVPAVSYHKPPGPVFGVGKLTASMEAVPTGEGIFIPNGATLAVDVFYAIGPDETVELSTGLVMARYTTKEPLPFPGSIKSPWTMPY